MRPSNGDFVSYLSGIEFWLTESCHRSNTTRGRVIKLHGGFYLDELYKGPIKINADLGTPLS